MQKRSECFACYPYLNRNRDPGIPCTFVASPVPQFKLAHILFGFANLHNWENSQLCYSETVHTLTADEQRRP